MNCRFIMHRIEDFKNNNGYFVVITFLLYYYIATDEWWWSERPFGVDWLLICPMVGYGFTGILPPAVCNCGVNEYWVRCKALWIINKTHTLL